MSTFLGCRTTLQARTRLIVFGLQCQFTDMCFRHSFDSAVRIARAYNIRNSSILSLFNRIPEVYHHHHSQQYLSLLAHTPNHTP